MDLELDLDVYIEDLVSKIDVQHSPSPNDDRKDSISGHAAEGTTTNTTVTGINCKNYEGQQRMYPIGPISLDTTVGVAINNEPHSQYSKNDDFHEDHKFQQQSQEFPCVVTATNADTHSNFNKDTDFRTIRGEKMCSSLPNILGVVKSTEVGSDEKNALQNKQTLSAPPSPSRRKEKFGRYPNNKSSFHERHSSFKRDHTTDQGLHKGSSMIHFDDGDGSNTSMGRCKDFTPGPLSSGSEKDLFSPDEQQQFTTNATQRSQEAFSKQCLQKMIEVYDDHDNDKAEQHQSYFTVKENTSNLEDFDLDLDLCENEQCVSQQYLNTQVKPRIEEQYAKENCTEIIAIDGRPTDKPLKQLNKEEERSNDTVHISDQCGPVNEQSSQKICAIEGCSSQQTMGVLDKEEDWEDEQCAAQRSSLLKEETLPANHSKGLSPEILPSQIALSANISSEMLQTQQIDAVNKNSKTEDKGLHCWKSYELAQTKQLFTTGETLTFLSPNESSALENICLPTVENSPSDTTLNFEKPNGEQKRERSNTLGLSQIEPDYKKAKLSTDNDDQIMGIISTPPDGNVLNEDVILTQINVYRKSESCYLEDDIQRSPEVAQSGVDTVQSDHIVPECPPSTTNTNSSNVLETVNLPALNPTSSELMCSESVNSNKDEGVGRGPHTDPSKEEIKSHISSTGTPKVHELLEANSLEVPQNCHQSSKDVKPLNIGTFEDDFTETQQLNHETLVATSVVTVHVQEENTEHLVPTGSIHEVDPVGCSDASLYCNQEVVELKPYKGSTEEKRSAFKWTKMNVNAESESPVEASIMSGLNPMVRLTSAHGRLRVGLSKKQKVAHLHQQKSPR